MERHDYQRIEHIVDYCEDIEDVLARVNDSYDTFLSDRMAQYAVAFSILQIGELVESSRRSCVPKLGMRSTGPQ